MEPDSPATVVGSSRIVAFWKATTGTQKVWLALSLPATWWVMDKAVDQFLAHEYALGLWLTWFAGLVFVVFNLSLLRSIQFEHISALSLAFLGLGSFAMGAIAMYCTLPVPKESAPKDIGPISESATTLPFGFELSEARHFQPDGRVSDGDPFQGSMNHGHRVAFLIGQYEEAQRAGDSVAALQFLTDIEKTQPSFIYVDYYRMIYLEKLKRQNEAERARRQLKERVDIVLYAAPAHQYALFVQAVCLLKEGERSASEKVLKQIDPQEIEKVMHEFVQFPTVPMVEMPPWRTFYEAYLHDHNTGLYEEFRRDHPAATQ
jgi:hypothetical protein